VVEAVAVAVFAHFLLDLPWIWGFLLGWALTHSVTIRPTYSTI
jgi:NhaP-type Na+/H+ and K+/H+ antiporter